MPDFIYSDSGHYHSDPDYSVPDCMDSTAVAVDSISSSVDCHTVYLTADHTDFHTDYYTADHTDFHTDYYTADHTDFHTGY